MVPVPSITDQNHHVIPRSFKNHSALKSADFDIDSTSNLIYLPKDRTVHATRSIHNGWNKDHAQYNQDIMAELDEISAIGKEEGWNQQQYNDAVNDLRRDTRQNLRQNKTKCG
ncbi:AHH domain-containing protein [Vibrio vulnificus]|nr:AHH domain-containing protein [Vibrio vulnificus]